MSEIDSADVGHEIALRSLGLAPVPFLGQNPEQETKAVPPISEPALGKTDVTNIVYVNTIPDIPEARTQLKELQEANELTSQYFSVKAAESADLQIKAKQLPTDGSIDSSIKRSNYRSKIIDFAIVRTNWYVKLCAHFFLSELTNE